MGTHREQRLAATQTGPRQQTDQVRERERDPGPKQQKGWPHETQAQNLRSADQTPGCLLGTTPKSTGSEKLLHSPCAQSPAGPTGYLGLRQNTQQREAAGLGETAFPRNT